MRKSVMLPVVLMGLAMLSWWYTISRQRVLSAQYERTTVLVARYDLPANVPITLEMLETRVIPAIYIQQDACVMRSQRDLHMIDGRVTLVRIPKGNQISLSCLANPQVPETVVPRTQTAN